MSVLNSNKLIFLSNIVVFFVLNLEKIVNDIMFCIELTFLKISSQFKVFVVCNREIALTVC